jgi:hypothetical protein
MSETLQIHRPSIKSYLNKLLMLSIYEIMHNVIEISNQLLLSSPPILQPPTAFPKPIGIGEIISKLSTVIYLNKRVLIEFSM